MKLRLATLALLSLLVIPSRAQLIFHESFSYSDGYIVTVSTNLWALHSGGADAFVKNGKLQSLNTANTGDINRALTNSGTGTGPVGPVVYAAVTVNSTNLPVGAGNFFMHFKDNGTTLFKGRLFGIRGSAPNSWRLGMSAQASTNNVAFPLDLATNVDYRVVISYDTNLFLGTLWVDPVGNTDPNVQTGDNAQGMIITTIAFRQSNSGGQAGQILVDDLDVGLSFADMGLGAPKDATIYYQPQSAIIVNEAANTNISVVAGGAGTVTFQWFKDGNPLSDDFVNIVGSSSNVLSILNANTGNAGDYKAIITSTTNSIFAGSVTSSVAHVTVNTVPRPPVFVTQPQSATITIGSVATFTGLADGSSPLTYQWYVVTNSITNQLSGETSPTLTFQVLDSSVAGQYFLQAINPFDTTNSQKATLTVIPAIVTNIAYLRTKINITNSTPTDTNLMYQADGIVTSRTNTTGIANIQFYMQDATAGIVVFVGGGDGTNSNPKAGDLVRVKGQLGAFNNLFEFNLSATNTYHSVQVLSSGNPMPASRSFSDFSLTNNPGFMETNIEAMLVTVTNVFFSNAGSNFTPGQTLIITNQAGQIMALFVNGTALSQTNPPVVIPAFAYEVTAEMGHFQTTYELIPTRFVDIVTNLPDAFPLSIARNGNVSTITFPAADGSTYSLYTATDIRGPFTKIFGLNFLDASGFYVETNSAAARFYRATSP